jgi:hypothetical protein
MLQEPVFVSLTTLPSRIEHIRPSIESLLAGFRVPDRILIALPSVAFRERSTYVVPSFLADRAVFGHRVEIVNCGRDWGPGTKLIGSLPRVPPTSYLVIADDDVAYRPQFLANLIDAQQADHTSSFSHYTYRAHGLTVGQGCDGFSFWTPNLVGIIEFAERYIVHTPFRLHDDLWISFFLATKGISVRSLQSKLGGSLVYEPLVQDQSLRHLTGDLSREQLNRDGVRYLLSTGLMSPASIWTTRLRGACDSAAHKTQRLLARVLGLARR